MKQALASGLPQLERKLTDAQLDTFCAFGSALVEKNQVMNLTAITEPEQVARLHFLDCIALLGAANFYGKTVIDVGCGAGFPGVPLKIAEPSIDLTLLDSLKKRMDWRPLCRNWALRLSALPQEPRNTLWCIGSSMTLPYPAPWQGSPCWRNCVSPWCGWAVISSP